VLLDAAKHAMSRDVEIDEEKLSQGFIQTLLEAAGEVPEIKKNKLGWYSDSCAQMYQKLSLTCLLLMSQKRVHLRVTMDCLVGNDS